VAALVAGQRDSLGVFLDRRRNDFSDTAVMAKVDHLRAGRLHDPAHDVDRRIVPVKK